MTSIRTDSNQARRLENQHFQRLTMTLLFGKLAKFMTFLFSKNEGQIKFDQCCKHFLAGDYRDGAPSLAYQGGSLLQKEDGNIILNV